MQHDPPTRAAYPLKEAAVLLGVSLASIYRAIDRGELRRVKLGHRALIPASEIERFREAPDAEPSPAA